MANKITTHTVVINEEQWIWYSINSVLPYVDEMLITDLGSTDKTLEIIKTIKSPKIKIQVVPSYDHNKSVLIRQQLLEKTKTEWFFILDGDEIWPEKSIREIVSKIKSASSDLWGIVCPTINFLGDLRHVEEGLAGRYEFMGKRGHLALRAMKKLPGMKLSGTYPLEGYVTKSGSLIQTESDHLDYLEAPYCHMTNLIRSNSREKDKTVFQRRFKKEIGVKLPKDFKYPEVFYLPNRPSIVPDPFVKMSTQDKLIGALITPIKRLKRRII